MPLRVKTIAIGLMLTGISVAQYSARTDTNSQAYQSPIPAAGSGCTAGAQGCISGANDVIRTTDFPNTPIIRLTDYNTSTAPYLSGSGFYANNGNSMSNTMDVTDTRFSVWNKGGGPFIFSWDPTTGTTTELYPAPGCNNDNNPGDVFWSFVQPRVGYILAAVPHSGNPSNIDFVICQFDATSTTTQPSVSNGKVTQLVNLSTCASALGNVSGVVGFDSVSASADDQTIAAVPIVSGGQGGSGDVWLVAWNRTKGCRAWETDTGAVTGYYSGSPTGTVNITDRFTLHGGRLNKSGTYFFASLGSCISGACNSTNSPVYAWNIATLSVSTYASSGHGAVGWNNMVFASACSPSSIYHQQCFTLHPFNNFNSSTTINTYFPPDNLNWDQHTSWVNDNTTDTAPFLLSTSPGSIPGNFAPTYAWDNEILGVGSDGTVWRFAHTFNSYQENPNDYVAAWAIGNASQDGKYFLFTSDWNGTLGNDQGGSSCVLGSAISGRICRSDVFMAFLSARASTSLRAIVGSQYVHLTWMGSTDPDCGCPYGYNVYRDTVSNPRTRTLLVSGVSAQAWDDQTVQGGQTYYYAVTTLYQCHGVPSESGYSNEVSVVMPN